MSAAFPSLLVAESVTREAWQRSQIEMQPIQLCHFEATLANNRIEARRPLHHMDGLGFSAGVTAWTALQVMHLRWQSVLQVAQTLPNPLIDYVIQGAECRADVQFSQ